MNSTIDLAAIKRRCDAATTSEPYRNGAIWAKRKAGRQIWQITTKDLLHVAYVDFDANAEFIENARTDVPALVAEVARLREALRVEREACDEWRKRAECPDEDDDLFQYGEDMNEMCAKHDARRAAEKTETKP